MPDELDGALGEDPLLARPTPSFRTVAGGVLWKLGSQALVQTLGLAASLAVARMLLPREYGLASLALSLAAFGAIFSEVSLGAVLVQRRRITQTDASSLMWFSVVVGLTLTIVFVLLAAPLASLLRNGGLRPLLLGVAPVFMISTLGTVPTALLTRRMRFRALELRMMAAIVTAAGVSVAVAALGGGAWALVAQQLSQVTVLTTLAWIAAGWRPSAAFSRATFGGLASFGVSVAGSRALFTLGANIDTILVGRYLGAAPLGKYAIAYNILLIPLTRFAVPVQEVTFPAFSSVGQPAAVGRLWLRANRALLILIAPIMIGLVVEADDLIRVVLGERWEDAIPVLRLLAAGGILQAATRLTPNVLLSCGRQGLLFTWSALYCAGLVAGFAVGLQWGIAGVAASYAVVNALAAPVVTVVAMRTTAVDAGTMLRTLYPVFGAAAVMSLGMLALKYAVPLGDLAALLAVPALGSALFIGFLIRFAPQVVAEVRAAVRSFRTPVEPERTSDVD